MGLAIRCLTRVVARSWTGRATAFLTCTVPTTVSSASRTGNRECPVLRASSITCRARSPSSSESVRTRGVMISPAVRVPNSTERSIAPRCPRSRVPTDAEREMSEASSVELRAERSSSWGSSPRRRTTALAEPLSSRMGIRMAAVNARMNRCVARAVCMGLAMARFLGTSSPKIMVRNVPSASPIAVATGRTAPSGTPADSSGPRIRCETAGSARNPMARLVTVMPTWAPDSCVESDRRALCTPCAAWSPASAARSTWARSTVTNANSAATKTPQAAINSSARARRSRSVTAGSV